ncbi:Ger(x)C family spore germination protein [Paenibacillus sedimenti]|uniref:Ger(X)C family spore germination protein n=1 Tax=Paenibacillus sedimenti TaxID=2770274 RepID=A0A926KPQ7_9BACL|nr:Ger(x)C family spore germination protein [Paenibacillus sedimenti]MBD0381048.1 Ger(x)C family spore germination protein [Paenibacillus sedimenti]
MIPSRILYVSLALILCLGLFTGCWDREEIDDLALVMASGLDLSEDGQLEVTLQIALPLGIPSALQSGGKREEHVMVVSAKGKEGLDILGKLQQQLSRKIFLGHRGVLVIGEKYARHGIDQVLDDLLRAPESRYNSFVVTAFGTTAKEVLNTTYLLEEIPAIGINKIQFGEFSLSFKIDEFLNAVASFEASPITGAVRIIKTGTGQPSFTIDRAAVYRGNKLTGFLSQEELKAKRWWHGEAKGMFITSQVEPKDKDFNGTITVEVMQGTTKIHTSIKDGLPEVSVTFKAAVRGLANNTKLDMNKAPNMKRIEAKISEDMHKLIADTISRTQKELKADIFSFGREVHIEHPDVWKTIKDQWMDIYPNVPVKVKVDIQIERMGRTQAPAHQKIQKYK